MSEQDSPENKEKDNTASRVVGTGVGIAGGAAAGAAAGSLVGPAGTAIGAIVGAAVGGIAGDQVAHLIDPNEEESYWATQYPTCPYYNEETPFEEYRPAYRYGVKAVDEYPGEDFDVIEVRLQEKWTSVRGDSTLTWVRARDAVRDAFVRTAQLRAQRLSTKENGEGTTRKERARKGKKGERAKKK